MEKEEYDPDTDYNGARGIARADYLLRKYGSIENIRKSSHSTKKKESPLEILSKTDPSKLKDFGDGKVFDSLFKKIQNAGYVIKNDYGLPIKNFSLIDGSKKWGIYIKLMKEFDLLSTR